MFLKLFFIILLADFISAAYTIPKYITPCLSKNGFTECALKSTKEALPVILNGDKKYNIPNLKPLQLPEVEINSGENFAITFKNLKVYGLETIKVENIQLNDLSVVVELYLSNIELIGDYNTKGRILILPIQGEGPANITFENAHFTYSLQFETYDKNGKTYATIASDKLDYKVKQAYFKLDNLFNGDEKLGTAMNTFLNENWNDVLKEVGGAVQVTIKTIVRQIISNFLKNIPFHELFP